MKVKWWERLLVEWAACVMTNERFSTFLAKYGLAINERLELIRPAYRLCSAPPGHDPECMACKLVGMADGSIRDAPQADAGDT